MQMCNKTDIGFGLVIQWFNGLFMICQIQIVNFRIILMIDILPSLLGDQHQPIYILFQQAG